MNLVEDILINKNDILLIKKINNSKELPIYFIYELIDSRNILPNGLANRYYYTNLKDAIISFEKLNHKRDIVSFIKYYIKNICQKCQKLD